MRTWQNCCSTNNESWPNILQFGGLSIKLRIHRKIEPTHYKHFSKENFLLANEKLYVSHCSQDTKHHLKSKKSICKIKWHLERQWTCIKQQTHRHLTILQEKKTEEIPKREHHVYSGPFSDWLKQVLSELKKILSPARYSTEAQK